MYRDGEEIAIWVTGPGPYGLRLERWGVEGREGGRSGQADPIIITKLHKKSKARQAGLQVGDVVRSINGRSCDAMTLLTAIDIVEYSPSLDLRLLRGCSEIPRPAERATSSGFRYGRSHRRSTSPPSSSPFHSEPESTPGPSLALYTPSTSSVAAAASGQRWSTAELFHFVGSASTAAEAPERDGAASSGRYSATTGISLEEPWTYRKPVEIFDGGQEDRSTVVHRHPTVRLGSVLDYSDLDAARAEERRENAEELKGPEKQRTETPSTMTSNRRSTTDYPNWRKTESPPHRDLSPQNVLPPTESPQPPKPSFLSRQFVPGERKPQRWQPFTGSAPPSLEHGTEPKTLSHSPIPALSVDGLVHEVVIWSSKATETDQSSSSGIQKPLPWQQSQQPADRPVVAAVAASPPRRQKAPCWQPPSQQQNSVFSHAEPTPSQPESTFRGVESTPISESPASRGRSRTPATQPEEATEKLLPWQPSPPSQSRSLATSDSSPAVTSKRHLVPPRWQPTQQQHQQPQQHQQQQQPYGEDQRSGDQLKSLTTAESSSEGVSRPSEDGRGPSPVVDTLFLTRVVIDGSALAADAGTGNDLRDTGHAATTGAHRKLYGDSSFYEDPEHKYPTIEEQIKMARKVALLLTSPANRNAKGQRMFLKRKEQSSKWIIDINNIFNRHPDLALTMSRGGHGRGTDEPSSHVLSPDQVERMRFSKEKSRHDVVPFNVCSMLAAELREEKGRGGRLFAKRRHKAEEWTVTQESNGFIQVPTRSRSVPVDKAIEAEHNTSIRAPPPSLPSAPPPALLPSAPPPALPSAPPPASARREKAAEPEPLAVPVNRLKDMIDPPRARITPWDSAVQYGTIDPAFEHLRDYLPFASASAVPSQTRATSNFSSQTRPLEGPDYGARRPTQAQDRIYSGVNPFERTEPPSYNKPVVRPHSTPLEPQARGGTLAFEETSQFDALLRNRSSGQQGYRPVQFQVGSRNYN